MKYRFLRNFLLDEDHFDEQSRLNKEEDYSITEADAIPLVLGNARVKGRLIYNIGITRAPNFATFAIGICQGPITSVNNIYVNGVKKIFDEDKCAVYLGTSNQLVDSSLSAHLKDIPAFRGLAYVVFCDFPLQVANEDILELSFGELSNVIPQFSFDVVALCCEHQDRVSKIRAVNVIPGCGEFVYDTRCLYKMNVMNIQSVEGPTKAKINYSHSLAHSLVNVDFLKKELPNVEWVAPVVCWFGDDKEIEKCTISPRVEYGTGVAEIFEVNGGAKIEWKVAGYNRSTAQVVGFDDGAMRYGGTVSDESVINYLAMLKDKGYKIMFYPMIFLDLAGKPWRGEINGTYDQVKNFFIKPDGYNNFILHYAEIVKNYIDAFVIGSELEGITSIYKENNGTREFPAAKELSALAQKVRAVFDQAGKKHIKITYAANWSEYHHKGGWYHLDELWTCKAIDFIGIDAYFPATDTCDSSIDYHQIKEGYKKGDTYEYYYDNGTRKYCNPKFALKNIEHWWKNPHLNPDGQDSGWIPESKPIWLTEFGFSSLDKSTNEPNVFFDHNFGGNLPKLSSGETDFALQEEAICALVDHFDSISNSKGGKMIEQMFLWCWDSRYPAWPDKLFTKDLNESLTSYSVIAEEIEEDTLWADSLCWESGHWINGKFSSVSIREVVEEIFTKSGFSSKDFTIDSKLSGLMRALAINYSCSANSLLEILGLLYKFDIFYSPKGIFHVIARESNFDVENNTYSNILTFEDLRHSVSAPSFKCLQAPLNEIALELAFIEENHPELGFVSICTNSKQKTNVKLPVIMSFAKAYSSLNKILQSIQEKNNLFVIQVPFYFEVKPTQVIELRVSEIPMILRVISVNFYKREKELVCVKLPSLKSEKSLLLS
jgi:hypothetical protein